jgi:type II secretory pathway component GspD/PulD (secretin)
MGWLALVLAGAATGQDEERWLVFQQETDLRVLLVTLSKQLDINLDFDPGQVEGTLSIRSTRGLTLDGLWVTFNRRLAERGLACVQLPAEENLSIVPLDQAAGVARLELELPEDTRAGFVKVLRSVREKTSRDMQQALAQLLPKDGSVTASLSGTGHILVAGLRPQVTQALAALDELDALPEEAVIEELTLLHASPTAVAAQLEQLRQSQDKLAPGSSLPGSFYARPTRGAIVVVAPRSALPGWVSLVARLDRPDALVTRHYTPRRFGLTETAGLIEELVTREGTKPAGWKLTVDELTGTLIIDAPEGAQAEVEDLIERLETTDLGARRELRSFPIAHRDVEELVDLLDGLIASGGELPELRGEVVEDAAPPPRSLRAQPEVGQEALTLSADRDTNRLLAFGDPRLLAQLASLIETLDVPHPQVLLEVLVVNLNESDLFDVGVELRAGGVEGDVLGQFASLFGLGAPALDQTSLNAAGGTGGSGVILDPGDFSAVVRALESRTAGRTLTIPRVLVSNHQTATLSAVLQAPYSTTTSATSAVATTSFGGTSDAGTSVTVTPHVLVGSSTGKGDGSSCHDEGSVRSVVTRSWLRSKRDLE